MEISLLLTRQILSMVLMGIAGYILRRTNLISKEGSKGLSVACLYICLPCTIVQSFQIEMSRSRMNSFLVAFLISLILHLVLFGVVWIIRNMHPLTEVERASVIYSNCANLSVPLIISVFGSEYVLYSSAFLFAQTMFIWSHGKIMMSGEKSISFKKIFLNPCMIAFVIGIICMFTHIRIPSVANSAMVSLANCIGPIAMLTIGMMIADLSGVNLLGNPGVYIVMILRLLIAPVITILCCWIAIHICPIKIDRIVYLVVVLGSAGPAASTLTQMAQVYGKDPGYASAINVMTTLGCIVTIPIVIMFAQMFI